MARNKKSLFADLEKMRKGKLGDAGRERLLGEIQDRYGPKGPRIFLDAMAQRNQIENSLLEKQKKERENDPEFKAQKNAKEILSAFQELADFEKEVGVDEPTTAAQFANDLAEQMRAKGELSEADAAKLFVKLKIAALKGSQETLSAKNLTGQQLPPFQWISEDGVEILQIQAPDGRIVQFDDDTVEAILQTQEQDVEDLGQDVKFVGPDGTINLFNKEVFAKAKQAISSKNPNIDQVIEQPEEVVKNFKENRDTKPSKKNQQPEEESLSSRISRFGRSILQFGRNRD